MLVPLKPIVTVQELDIDLGENVFLVFSPPPLLYVLLLQGGVK